MVARASHQMGRPLFTILVSATVGLLWMGVRTIAASGSSPITEGVPFGVTSLSQSATHEWLWIPLLLTLVIPAVLSIPRLRDAGRPTPFAALALIPGLNFLCLGWFALLPSRDARQGDQTSLDPWMPHGIFGSAALGVAAGALIGAVAAGIASLTGGYGAWLFLGAPFVMGLVAAWTVAYRLPAPVPMQLCLGTALMSVVLCALMLVGIAIEGIICILMALPLAIPLALIGGIVGRMLANRTSNQRLSWAPAILLPALLTLAPAPQTPLRSAHTAIVIHAAPSQVWNAVVDQPSLPPPTAWAFRAGVGYPVSIYLPEARIGAVRRCQFSTGLVLERVDGLEPGRRLHFTIFQQGPLLRELSPYRIQPRHLDAEYVRSVAGEFVLTPRTDGTTLLETTSWYTCRYEPAAYWTVLTEGIIHDIHGWVLQAIRAKAEAQPRS